ncbi:YggS family pyridoxal phosphate-dependent enzyme [Brassicibacter mesophilus]|uniref:YggS family pyridoxal phosphate-dependent enzyme n=1 Tax=Brassicibacter mesophilus TaxID=745119 RepID=UPI003D1B8548
MSIQDNLLNIRNNINDITSRHGRDPKDVTLIAVTKTVDTDDINKAINFGITDIGENKVQEIEAKYSKVETSVKWHMIGHLQSNKVKYMIEKVDLIHSLDRMSLAKEIQKRANEHNIIVDTLIQVNVAEEESKFGLRYDEVLDFIEKIIKFENIRIKGLMTIAPYTDEPEEVRFVFKQLRNLFDEISLKNYKNVDMKYLSMGMTNDYQIALEEGANMIRIGTGIFGKRIYKED